MQAHEAKMFHNLEGVQHPQECLMPDPAERSIKRRRLGESLVSQGDAEAACAGVAHSDEFQPCVKDILATNDLTMAGIYV